MPRNTEKSPIEFKRIVREIYRQCSKGNDTRHVRTHDCEDCGNLVGYRKREKSIAVVLHKRI